MSSMLTVQECAEALRVSSKTIYRLVWSGNLPGHKVGGRLRISRGALDAYLDSRAFGTGARAARDADDA